MRTILFFQRGTPDIINLILLLIGILLCLLALNSLYEWIKSRPWRKINTPDDNISKQDEGYSDNENINTNSSNDSPNHHSLQATISS